MPFARGIGGFASMTVAATAGPFTSIASSARGCSSPKTASGFLGPSLSTAERPGWNHSGASRATISFDTSTPSVASSASASALAS